MLSKLYSANLGGDVDAILQDGSDAVVDDFDAVTGCVDVLMFYLDGVGADLVDDVNLGMFSSTV